ncbi:MAG TPA: porin family protein [Cyclobacteriaceae bacterium]|jgi:hypothetical protein|nr:porin family protein [Cyclobacteriaceae bacterium]
MSKTLLLSALLMFASLCVSHAQNFEGEIIAGPSLTSLRGNDVVNSLNPSINFFGGLGINYHLKANSLLNVRLLFDKKGATSDNLTLYSGPDPNSAYGTEKVIARSNYLTLPVQYKYRLGKKIQYEFGLGMYTAYLISHYQIIKTTGTTDFSDGKENNTKDYKRGDLGLSTGIGILIPLQKSFSLNISINDNLGLINTSKVPVYHNGTVKNNSLMLLLGVNYKFKYDQN